MYNEEQFELRAGPGCLPLIFALGVAMIAVNFVSASIAWGVMFVGYALYALVARGLFRWCIIRRPPRERRRRVARDSKAQKEESRDV